jgi:hypothetical protein
VNVKGIEMKYQYKLAAALVFAAVAGVSSAQGLTRAQVKAQLQEAIQNGDMLAPGDAGLTERQLYPSEYPAQAAAAPGKTRAEVQAELQTAIRDGDMLAPGDSGLTLAQEDPAEYPAPPVVVGKTRAQVRAETAMAIRDGDIIAPGDAGLTFAQEDPREYATQRAIDAQTMQAQQEPVQGPDTTRLGAAPEPGVAQ